MIDKIVIQTANKTENNAKNIMDSMYLDNQGFFCCKKCNTRKQIEISIFGSKQRVYCDCQCEQLQYQKEREQYLREQEIARIEEYKRYGFSNENFGNYNFSMDNFPSSNESLISKKYVKYFEEMKKSNTGLLFYGDCDTGKSFYSSCICNALSNQGYFTIMTSLSKLEDDMTKNFKAEKNAILDRVRECDLLILDDVGIERKTQTSLENIFDVVNARYISHKPIIISTNLMPSQLCTDNVELKRIYQRIMEGTKKVECKIPHHRKTYTDVQLDALKLLE